ncbi:hypothetical protein DESUT3_20170 [Desulfuromonas versatilis]|uniref:Chalcone isomerase domain-containing protein n=1 Tax=Desulfuromonas versatilis TaxID=2802975 RepID=A0ABM8HWJ8_9BACT|nr:chalcone isomerase family protein [Desulfuromonas versatilis]BCR04948.1 hypothetical protein DESUT3_20170 [Desulfuromonas versatilis]
MKLSEISLQLGILLLMLLAVPANGQGKVISGVEFEDWILVGGEPLQLKGVAVLTWGIVFDVYAGALYLPGNETGRAWRGDIPKRLELAYFRSFAAEDFVTSSERLLRDQLSESEYAALAERLTVFNRLYRGVRAGDRYNLTYIPGVGTQLRLNNELLGGVEGHDFAQAYFGIWLGERPISSTFRDRLLSESPP